MSLCKDECSDCCLGEGSFGKVLRGEYDMSKIQVAVKKIKATDEKEVNMLPQIDNHDNILRYYCTEKDNPFT